MEPGRRQLVRARPAAAPGRRRAARRARARPSAPAGRTPSQPSRNRSPTATPSARQSRGRVGARGGAAARPADTSRPDAARRSGVAAIGHGTAWSRATAARTRSSVARRRRVLARRSQASSSSRQVGHQDRDRRRRPRPPRGTARRAARRSGNGVAATNPSRSAWSRVARAIQSTAQDVRLRTNAARRRGRTSRSASRPTSRRWRTPPRERRSRPCSASRSAERPRRPSASARGGDVVRAVRPAVEVDDVRIRAVAGQHDDERLAVARRSPRRGSRRPGCRRSRRPPPRTRARGRSGPTCSCAAPDTM